MVAPVVVKPELASKRQSTKEAKHPENQKGRLPNRQVTTQMRPTITKPSLWKNTGRAGIRARGAQTHRISPMVRTKGQGLSP